MTQIKYSRFVFVLAAVLTAQAFFAVTITNAQTDVTSPGNPVQIVNGMDDGDGDAGPPPADEGVGNAIDNTTNKYLNFLDLNSGLTVTPTGSTRVTGLRVYTANDSTERDPASYLLEGSNNGGATWTQISTGTLNLPAGRNATGQPITTPGLFSDTVTFSNLTAYTSYRLTFPTLKDADAANSMQIGEIELLNAPATAASLTISGRVLSFSNRSAAFARVFLMNQNGEIRMSLTNHSGYYRFVDVQAGETYIFDVRHKQYRFAPRVLTVTDEISDLNFVAEP